MKFKALIALLLLHSVNSEWKPFSNETVPSVDGITAGLNHQGQELYIGLGTFQGQTSPAELITLGEKKGLYFPYGRNVKVLTSGIKYYAKETDCEYLWVNSSNGAAVYQAIQILSPPYTFLIGRVFTVFFNHVGSVNLQHRVMYYVANDTVRTAASYEVFTCKRSYTTTRNPRINSFPIGSWRGQRVELREELDAMKKDLEIIKGRQTNNEKFNG